MIRWIWSRMMKWGWDFGRELPAEDGSKTRRIGRGSNAVAQSPVRVFDADIELENPLRFTVQSAIGGTIVEIRHYDRKTDRSSVILHLIPLEEDIALRVGQIVSMEMLRSNV